MRPGYKQTEVGLLPEDWAVATVGTEFSIQLGKMLDVEKNVGVPKPFLGNRAVQWGRVDLTDIGEIKLTSRDLQRYRLRDGDLLVCEGGEIGRAAVWRQPMVECYYQKALHRLRPIRGYNVQLMLNMLQRLASTGFLLNFVTQTSIAHLPKDKFETVPIPVPPTKAEQETIAGALSDADALIESLEQLVSKKRHLKQGAMQELLTGKKRLPGFNGEWAMKLFGEIAQPRKERIDPRRTGRHDFCIELEHIEQGTGCLIGNTVTSEGSSLKSVFQKDDVLFGKLRAYLRKYWLASRGGVCSTEIWVLTAERGSVTPQFLFQLVKVDRFIEAASSAYGTHMPRSDWHVVKNYEVGLPPVPEQVAIAHVLSDMDAEVAALEAKLIKARQLKRGMMQELLTGRIRLI